MSAEPFSRPKSRRVSPFDLRKAGPLGILYHGLGLAAIFASSFSEFRSQPFKSNFLNSSFDSTFFAQSSWYNYSAGGTRRQAQRTKRHGQRIVVGASKCCPTRKSAHQKKWAFKNRNWPKRKRGIIMPYLNLKTIVNIFGVRLMREKETGQLFLRCGQGPLRRLSWKKAGRASWRRKRVG